MLGKKWFGILACPRCKNGFAKLPLYCAECKKEYPVVDGIPILVSQGSREHTSVYKYQVDRYDKEWGRHNQDLTEWQKRYLRRIFGLFRVRPSKGRLSKKYLDIGVGAAGYTVIEAARRGLLSVGCDISIEGVRRARFYAEKKGVGERTLWVVCNAENLPFQSGVFSYISSNAVLEHLPNDEKGVQEMDRVASKRADLFITVPLKYRYVWPFFIPMNFVHDKIVGHLRRYDCKTLDRRLENTSFFMVYDMYTGYFWKTILFIFSSVFRVKIFDELMERIDSKRVSRPYGATNISVYARNYQ